MRRGTTPIVTITVDEQDFSGCTVLVTIDQDGTQVTKSNKTSDDIEITKNYDDGGNFVSSSIAIYLTQADTLKFEVGPARVQLRWIDYLNNAYASDISTIQLDEVLLDREISYGE